jgi:hypothetical protein
MQLALVTLVSVYSVGETLGQHSASYLGGTGMTGDDDGDNDDESEALKLNGGKGG